MDDNYYGLLLLGEQLMIFYSDSRYQQILHRNLVYLASIADSNQNIQTLLPVSTEVTLPNIYLTRCSITQLLLPAAITAGSSNCVTNTRCCRYSCLRS